jgi:para-nitrobenzyl esterase
MPTLTPPVQTTHGSIAGAIEGDIAVFRGIPFAASQAGDARWRAPGELAAWSGVRAATAFGPDPIQPRPKREDTLRSDGNSEDALLLNIWKPARHDGAPLPVMVWFEGGGFMTISASNTRIDGAVLARRGVILVTVAYRVNIFGFLAHPLLTAESEHHSSSNYGMLDQIAALRWIRANIAAFGGDDTRITVFGVSAGSASIALLLTSPLARGLFDRAILHSPGALRPLCTLADAEAAGSVAGNDLAAMRAMSVPALMDVIPKIVPKVRGLTTPRILRPICDGYVVPRQESDAYDDGDFMHVPMLVGSTANEGSIFVADLPIGTVDEYRAYMQQNFGDATAEALALYAVQTDADVKPRLAEIFGDTQFSYGARGVARASAKVQPQTFRYLFRAGTAAHGEDTPYVFGNLPADATAVDRAVSELQLSAWTHFAATGDPNGPGVPDWPAFTAANDAYLEIGDGPCVGSGWHGPGLDFIDRYLHAH